MALFDTVLPRILRIEADASAEFLVVLGAMNVIEPFFVADPLGFAN